MYLRLKYDLARSLSVFIVVSVLTTLPSVDGVLIRDLGQVAVDAVPTHSGHKAREAVERLSCVDLARRTVISTSIKTAVLAVRLGYVYNIYSLYFNYCLPRQSNFTHKLPGTVRFAQAEVCLECSLSRVLGKFASQDGQ